MLYLNEIHIKNKNAIKRQAAERMSTLKPADKLKAKILAATIQINKICKIFSLLFFCIHADKNTINAIPNAPHKNTPNFFTIIINEFITFSKLCIKSKISFI